MSTAATVHRYTVALTGEARTSVKIPKGYPHAGRWARLTAQDATTATVFVPQKARRMSARITPAANVIISLADIPALIEGTEQ